MESYFNLFFFKEEIEIVILEIKEILVDYDLLNVEYFVFQIFQINDQEMMWQIKKVLDEVCFLYNMIWFFGEYELLECMDFIKLNCLWIEVINWLDFINVKEVFENSEEVGNLFNMVLEDVIFGFKKIGESELILVGEFKDIFKKIWEVLGSSFDRNDLEWVSLYEELRCLFDNKNFNEVLQEEMQDNIKLLKAIYNWIKEFNCKNDLLREKYKGDFKYVWVYKWLIEVGRLLKMKIVIMEVL